MALVKIGLLEKKLIIKKKKSNEGSFKKKDGYLVLWLFSTSSVTHEHNKGRHKELLEKMFNMNPSHEKKKKEKSFKMFKER